MSPPSTPCNSSSCNRACKSASWEDKRSDSISMSLADFAMRNFCVSSVAISEAWAAEEWEEIVSRWWLFRVVKVLESSTLFSTKTSENEKVDLLLSALSDSRILRSRACCSVESDSLMRETASLSGVMLKFPIVWWISWDRDISWSPGTVSYTLTVAGSSSRSMIVVLRARATGESCLSVWIADVFRIGREVVLFVNRPTWAKWRRAGITQYHTATWTPHELRTSCDLARTLNCFSIIRRTLQLPNYSHGFANS